MQNKFMLKFPGLYRISFHDGTVGLKYKKRKILVSTIGGDLVLDKLGDMVILRSKKSNTVIATMIKDIENKELIVYTNESGILVDEYMTSIFI